VVAEGGEGWECKQVKPDCGKRIPFGHRDLKSDTTKNPKSKFDESIDPPTKQAHFDAKIDPKAISSV
jgi:hypothetical protein